LYVAAVTAGISVDRPELFEHDGPMRFLVGAIDVVVGKKRQFVFIVSYQQHNDTHVLAVLQA
jgi:hypothetical protein